MPLYKIAITGKMTPDLDLGTVAQYLQDRGYVLTDGVSRGIDPDGTAYYMVSVNKDPTTDLQSWSPPSPGDAQQKILADYKTAALGIRALTPTSGPLVIISAMQAYERAVTNVLRGLSQGGIDALSL